MSWAEEDWTVGLSGKVLQKVKELQIHHERLSRDNKQKQLLLDSIQTSLEKQTAKYEEARVELQLSHRELQKVQEEAKATISSKERLSQDLQSKQAQVCSLEGQLDAARTLASKLTQEVKRLEAELEKLQNSSRSAESTVFSTPCWSASPWELSGSRKEDRHGSKDEGKTQGHHVRRLQFSDKSSGSLPREQPRGAHHHQTSDIFSSPSAAFPWEREDAKPMSRRPSPVSPNIKHHEASSQNQLEPNPCVTINRPNDSSESKLQSHMTDLEEKLRVNVEALNTIQNEVAQNKKELAAKEINLQRLRDELSLAHTRMSQEGERVSAAEQKTKQLQEELKCQRQNAESSRLQHQQRTKELEKQHQRDMQEFQKERQHMERQHQQEKNKLNQELSQARSHHNALQAQLDKESAQKNTLIKEVETLKEKLKWTEGQLQQSQKKEAQTQAKLKEALSEAEALTVCLKQSQKKERALEEDERRLTRERDDALCALRDLQEQKSAMALHQPLPQIFPTAGSSSQTSISNASQPLHQSQKLNTINLAKKMREEQDTRAEIKVPYPTDREPGEGIDSEHICENISMKSEDLKRQECCLQTKREEVLKTYAMQTITKRTHTDSSKQTVASEDLRAENAALCSELRDVREELQKRLDDLEAQRRAETEARSRLKQLSRKNACQITEKEEQYKECKTQLEKERSEVDRLTKALAALETEMMRQEDCVMNNKENNTVLQEKEDEMIELNMEVKKQLSEVKAQLVLEREEWKQQEIEMMNKISTAMAKIEELEAEIEKLKSSQNGSQAEEVKHAANSPVTYFTLQEDEFKSDVVDETGASFCQLTNQRNSMICQILGHSVPAEETSLIDPKHTPVTLNDLEQESLNQEQNVDKKNIDELSVLTTQVNTLLKQNALEKERANQYQIKLQVLQNQVTQQTQQLTMAFEMQSKHISGLLVELQEKENSILQKDEEIQQCKQEFSALKDQMIKENIGQGQERVEPSSTGINIPVAENLIDGTVQLTSSAESPVVDICQQMTVQHTAHTIQHNQSLVNEVSTGSKEEADLAKELLNLQQENHLLKLKIKSMIAPKLSGINADITSALPLEEQTSRGLSYIGVQACTDDQQSRSDMEKPEAGSQQLDHISYLQQQVVTLQTKLQALSEENQQKSEELELWRLASAPVCALTDSEHTQEHSLTDMHHTTPEQSRCVSLIREDEILLSCSSNKLQGRTLFSRLQQNLISEAKTFPLFSILQEHNKNHSESDKENTSPTQRIQRNDSKNVRRSLDPEPFQVLDCCAVNPSSTDVTMMESITGDAEVEVKCAGTQTESPCLPPELRVHLQAAPEKEPPSVSPAGSKGMMLSASFPIPADPARLAERIRRNRTKLSAAFDDTEYEPYGLPEVVMKGFADIPSGPSCPYIVRRGLLGTAAVPVLPTNMAEAEETD